MRPVAAAALVALTACASDPAPLAAPETPAALVSAAPVPDTAAPTPTVRATSAPAPAASGAAARGGAADDVWSGTYEFFEAVPEPGGAFWGYTLTIGPADWDGAWSGRLTLDGTQTSAWYHVVGDPEGDALRVTVSGFPDDNVGPSFEPGATLFVLEQTFSPATGDVHLVTRWWELRPNVNADAAAGGQVAFERTD